MEPSISFSSWAASYFFLFSENEIRCLFEERVVRRSNIDFKEYFRDFSFHLVVITDVSSFLICIYFFVL